MLVSVIIPTFNSEKYLDRAINSVFNQSYKELEIILIDDYSTDKTSDLIKNYANQHGDIIKYRFLDINVGPAAARNVGLKMANGGYIAFLDSDDEWAPTKLEKQIKLLKENPQVTIVGCARQESGPEGEIFTEKITTPEIMQDGWLRLMSSTFICTPSVVIRREAIIGEFFNENMKVSEDRDFWIRIAKKGYLGFVPEILVTTYSDGNYMSDNFDKSVENLLPMLQLIFDRYKDEIPASVKRNSLGHAYTIIGKEYGEKGYFFICLYYLTKAIFLGHRVGGNLNTIINQFPPVHYLKSKLRGTNQLL